MHSNCIYWRVYWPKLLSAFISRALCGLSDRALSHYKVCPLCPGCAGFLFQFSLVKNTMRKKNVALLLILFPVCGHHLDFTYYTDSYKRNWASAQEFCREHHTDLVQIRNAEESEVFEFSGWIGLYREDASSPWKWSRGGEIAIFTMWDHNGNI